MESQPPIIARLNIADDDYLSLSLACLLPGESLAELRSQFLSQLRGARFNSPVELAQLVDGALAGPAATDPGIAAARAVLHRSMAEAMANSTIYRTTGKANPHALYWPDPTDQNDRRHLFDEMPFVAPRQILDRKTAIGSAGSCFATEIAQHLRANGFNYIVTEPNDVACANWGIIFNTASFRQLIEVAYGLRERPRLLWVHQGDQGTEYRDPFREDVAYTRIEDYEPDRRRHLAAARAALDAVKVFVITLGVNETWALRNEDWVLSRVPWNMAPHLTERRVPTVAENVADLEKMLAAWSHFNPDVHLVVTVSPVPLHATFRAETHHVIAANQLSKATLLLAADEFCRNHPDRTSYFPSYELVMNCAPTPFQPDLRHVTRDTVGRVMTMFERMFVRPE